jgi:hypothetical protein
MSPVEKAQRTAQLLELLEIHDQLEQARQLLRTDQPRDAQKAYGILCRVLGVPGDW